MLEGRPGLERATGSAPCPRVAQTTHAEAAAQGHVVAAQVKRDHENEQAALLEDAQQHAVATAALAAGIDGGAARQGGKGPVRVQDSWYVSGFIATSSGMHVKLRQNGWLCRDPGRKQSVFTRAEWQAHAGQPLEDICVGDEVRVMQLELAATPSAVAIVPHRSTQTGPSGPA
eukprot:COSAG01_NODE_237_length_20722_cov_360.895747_16_plen_173_part_00